VAGIARCIAEQRQFAWATSYIAVFNISRSPALRRSSTRRRTSMGNGADDADYRQESASLGIRMGVNFAVYALAH
jgi:hypothetical protein